MRESCLRGGVLVVMLAILGCGGKTTIQPTPDSEHLGDRIDLSVKKWLDSSREDLAKRGEELAKVLAEQRRVAREQPQSVTLLPDLHPCPNTPVFAEANYSAEAGFSVPPYYKGGTDAELAQHLARFGDHEAARKLGGAPAAAGKNYPVEWTRLVSLAQQSAEWKLASGEPEGAAELIGLHRQLREALDEPAARGPLGASLLSGGRRALALAAKAWKEDKPSLAEDVEKALAEWAPTPEVEPALKFGDPRTKVEQLLGVVPSTQSRSVGVREPAGVQRALDFLSLPVPSDWVEGIVAFLDVEDRLAEIDLVYRERAGRHYPEPRHLAQRLEEQGFHSTASSPASGLNHETYERGGLKCDLYRVLRGQAAGGLVRLTGKGPANCVSEGQLRALGVVHLDRSFTRQRLDLAPFTPTNPVLVQSPEVLAEALGTLGVPPPSELVLTQVPGHDLLGPVTFRWPAGHNAQAVASLLVPLWAAYGPAAVHSVKDDRGEGLGFVWEVGHTRLQLLIPSDGKSPELALADTRAGGALAGRIERTKQFDETERRGRAAAGRPDSRLSRSPGVVNGIDFRWLQLGAPRDQVQAGLPRATTIHRTDLPDGVSLLFLDSPASKVEHWARQLFVRFDREGKLTEVRVRYLDRLRNPGKGAPSLLERLTNAANASPEREDAWEGLWADLPAQKPAPEGYRWGDDRTVITCRRDAGGAEVVWRDRTTEEAGAVTPLRFCGRGVEGCQLGDAREAVLAQWKITTPTPGPDGSIVLEGLKGSPYAVVLAWFEGGKVSRVVARHREPWPVPAGDVARVLQQVWSGNLAHLGAIRRQEPAHGLVLGAYGWHDDETRVRTFVQRGSEGPELLTEWRTWPVPSR